MDNETDEKQIEQKQPETQQEQGPDIFNENYVWPKIDQQRTKEKKGLFLHYFLLNRGVIRKTCKDAGIHHDTFYSWRQTDPDFVKKLHLL
ncbi:MAG: hypothetical protein WC596_04930 [Candidatus Shapirobacteria bacterium]